MNGLALDLGTKTGFAATCGMLLAAGTWELAKPAVLKSERVARMDRRLDIRIPNLYSHLHNHHIVIPLDWIFFEDVQSFKRQQLCGNIVFCKQILIMLRHFNGIAIFSVRS